MKLSSQEEFGLRCLVALARSHRDTAPKDGRTLSVHQIAEAEGISTEYVGKLMGVLVRAELVDSVRGRYGGYRLGRDADKISLSEALTALGGKIYETTTCDRFSGERDACIHATGCSIRSVWSGLQMMFDHVFSRTSIADLVNHSERSMDEWVYAHAQTLASLGSPRAHSVSDRIGH